MDWLYDWLNQFWLWFVSLVSDLWQAVTDFIYNIFYGIFDVMLSVFESIVSSIPVPAAWTVGSPLDSLSAQALYLLNAIGTLEVLAIILGAFLVRFALNLIPGAFTRV